MMFQSLIGRVQTFGGDHAVRHEIPRFQSLIGRVQTPRKLAVRDLSDCGDATLPLVFTFRPSYTESCNKEVSSTPGVFCTTGGRRHFPGFQRDPLWVNR